MADNTTLNAGSGGDLVASDDIGGVKFQRVKVIQGADGVNGGDTSTANPFPIQTRDSSGNAIGSILSGGIYNHAVALGATNYAVSTNNSTTVQLAASATFTGVVETAFNQQSYSILITSDQNGTLVVKQYIDAAGLKLASSLSYSITASTPFARSGVVNGNYFSLTFQNTGASTTTTLQVDTAYGTIPSATQLNNSPVAINEINGVALNIGQQTKALSIPMVMPSDQNLVSTVNSSTATLGIGGVFTGTSEDISQYAVTRVYVFSDVASATDGLSLQKSSNGTNWDSLDVYTIPANTGKTFSVSSGGKFFRVVYTNGGTAQASFRLQITHCAFAGRASSQRPQDARSNDNDMEEQLSYLMLFNGTSWDRARSGSGVSSSGTLRIVPAQEQTYRASTLVPLVAAVTVNVPFFNIIGSATKTVRIKRISVSGMTLTAVGYFTINVEKLSTASTAGTSTTLTATPLDSANNAATAVVKAYTVAPTKGALVGTIRSFRTLWQATVAAAAGTTDKYDFSFGDVSGSGGVVLRGVAQELALTFPVVLASAGTLAVDIEWTEE